jgi:hypothetical protein
MKQASRKAGSLNHFNYDLSMILRMIIWSGNMITATSADNAQRDCRQRKIRRRRFSP